MCSAWRPTVRQSNITSIGPVESQLQQKDLPVKYISIAAHLDMVGVQLTASFNHTRQINGDKLREKVRNIIGPWRGGKFMPLTQRPFSANSFCLSKICFKSASINLREGDFNYISSQIKSWIFADQLHQLHVSIKVGKIF